MQNDIFQVKQIAANNRGLLAVRDIKQGEIILEAMPIAYATNHKSRHTFCNAYIKTESQLKSKLLRCSGCLVPHYCSADCQKQDWKVHKQQCKIFAVIKKEEKREVTQRFMLLVRMHMACQADKETEEKIQSMIELEKEEPMHLQMHYAEQARELMKYLKLQDSQQVFNKVKGLVCRAQANSFSVSTFLSFTLVRNSGVVYPANFFNHSCSPNIFHFSDGTLMKFMAVRDITKGTELTVTYCQMFTEREKRRSELKFKYYFDCQCYRCVYQKTKKIECLQPGMEQQARMHIARIKNDRQHEEQKLESFHFLRKNTVFNETTLYHPLQALFKSIYQRDLKSSTNVEICIEIVKALIELQKHYFGIPFKEWTHPNLIVKLRDLSSLEERRKDYKKAYFYIKIAADLVKKCKLKHQTSLVKQILKSFSSLELIRTFQNLNMLPK